LGAISRIAPKKQGKRRSRILEENDGIMVSNLKLGTRLALLAGLLTSGVVIPAAITRAAQGNEKTAATATPVSSPTLSPAPAAAHPPSSPASDTRSPRADRMYQLLWGIKDMHVRETASGSIIRFSYRVVDPAKAKVLNDPKLNPVLIDSNSGDKLTVPETENAGKLRQVADPEEGREYWMVFLNNSRFVKPGSKVDIKIGTFRADGLVVEPSMSAPAVKKP
jgi:hypothetical protein